MCLWARHMSITARLEIWNQNKIYLNPIHWFWRLKWTHSHIYNYRTETSVLYSEGTLQEPCKGIEFLPWLQRAPQWWTHWSPGKLWVLLWVPCKAWSASSWTDHLFLGWGGGTSDPPEAPHWKNIGISCIRSGKVKATGRSHFRHIVVIFPYSRICLIPLYLSC